MREYMIDSTNSIGKIRVSLYDYYVYGLCLFIIVSIINNCQFHATFSYTVIPVAITLVLFVINAGRIRVKAEYAYLLMFWLVGFFSTAISDKVEMQRDIFTYLLYVIFYITCTSREMNIRTKRRVIHCYNAVSLFLGVLVVINFVLGRRYGYFERYSVILFGVPKDPMVVTAFILPTICIALYRLLILKNNNRQSALFEIAVVLLLSGACVLSASRTTIAVLAVIIAAILLLSLGNRRQRAKALLLIIIFLTLSVIVVKRVVPEFILERLFSGDSYSLANDSRAALWEIAWTDFLDSPILGRGINQGYVHNVYLDIIAGEGILGVMFLGGYWLHGFRHAKGYRGFLCVLFIALFTPLFTINGFISATFWVPMIIWGIVTDNVSQTKDLLEFKLGERT